jgi:hypothetical protein
MKKVSVKKGGYYRTNQNPGIPFMILEITKKHYVISMLLRYQLNFSIDALDTLKDNNGIIEITEDEAKSLAVMWAI